MPRGAVSTEDQMEFSDQDFAIFAKADQSKKLKWDVSGIPTGITITTGYREVLRADRTYYVGANIPAPTITIASPAVVSSTAHGLSAGDAVVFNVPLNTKSATITAANPAVVTMGNTFSAGQPVKFSSTGSLPYGVVPGTTYYVISTGLSTSVFRVSATVGGSAISTAAPTAGFTNGSANITITTANTYYSIGQTVRFATTGGLPTNFATGTDYFVVSATSSLITVSATNGGSAIVAGSAGTGTQTALQSGSHFVSTAGLLPTGIAEGTAYYVSTTSLATNSFTLSDTQAHALAGTNAINTSGSVTGTPIYNAYTGSDSNTGLAQTRAGAFLSLQKPYDTVTATLDLAGRTVTAQVASGTFADGVSISQSWTGGGAVTYTGDTATPSNVLISRTNANVFSMSAALPGLLTIQGFELRTASGGSAVIMSAPGVLWLGNNRFGATNDFHIRATGAGANINIATAYAVTGGAIRHYDIEQGATLTTPAATVTLSGTVSFSGAFCYTQLGGTVQAGFSTYSGGTTGQRYNVGLNGAISVGGGGASFFPGNSAGATATGGQYA